MINLAKSANPHNIFFISKDGLNVLDKEFKFDLVYSIAVFAHIPNNLMDIIVQSIYDHLNYGSRLIVFEQVAPFRYEGDSFIRRTIIDYKKYFSKFGFTIEENTLLSFNTHRFFERYVAKYYFKIFCKSNNNFEMRIEANNHFWYRFLSHFFYFLISIQLLKIQSVVGVIYIWC